MSDRATTPLVRVLVIEDDAIQVTLLQHALGNIQDVDVKYAKTGRQALQLVGDWRPQVVVTDLRLPDMHGMDVLKEIRSQGLHCSVFAISATDSVDEAVAAVHAGAAEFMSKPLDYKRLQLVLKQAVANARLVVDLEHASETRSRVASADFIGESPVMKHLMAAVRAAARGRTPVLLLGERGTGREYIARRLHEMSGRAAGPFIILDNHEGLRSTESIAVFLSVLRGADGGTLYIPELRQLNYTLQRAVHSYIESRVIQGVPFSEDVRIVAAMDDSLPPGDTVQLVEHRLLNALRLVTLGLAPLRSRGNDIIHLAEAVLRRQATLRGVEFEGIAASAQDVLLHYAWPGNIDELIETLEGISRASGPMTLQLDQLPPHISKLAPNRARSMEAVPLPRLSKPVVKPLWLVEKEAIESALSACGGNVLEAARQLQISPATIYRKEKAWAAANGAAVSVG